MNNQNIPFVDESNIEGILELCNKPCIIINTSIESPTKESGNYVYQFLKLIKPFWKSKNKKKIRKWSASFIILIILQMALAVFVTQWTAGLFNALQAQSTS